MDIQVLGGLGEFLGGIAGVVAAVGVIISLLYLARQVQQSTHMTRIQLVHDSMLANQTMQIALAGANPSKSWARAIFDPTSLTDEDLLVLDLIMKANWSRATRIDLMESMGLSIFDANAPAQVITGEYLGNAFASAWWEARSGALLQQGSRVAEIIEEELSKRPAHSGAHKKQLERIREALEQRVGDG